MSKLNKSTQGKGRATSDAESVDSIMMEYNDVGSGDEGMSSEPAPPPKKTSRGKATAAAPKKAPAKKAPVRRGKKNVGRYTLSYHSFTSVINPILLGGVG